MESRNPHPSAAPTDDEDFARAATDTTADTTTDTGTGTGTGTDTDTDRNEERNEGRNTEAETTAALPLGPGDDGFWWSLTPVRPHAALPAPVHVRTTALAELSGRATDALRRWTGR